MIEKPSSFKDIVAKKKWFLAKDSPIVYLPAKEKRWPQLYFPFLHCDNSNMKATQIFSVRVSTMFNEGVFTAGEKCWIVSTIASRIGCCIGT